MLVLRVRSEWDPAVSGDQPSGDFAELVPLRVPRGYVVRSVLQLVLRFGDLVVIGAAEVAAVAGLTDLVEGGEVGAEDLRCGVAVVGGRKVFAAGAGGKGDAREDGGVSMSMKGSNTCR